MPFNPSPTGYFNGIVTLASGDSAPSSGVFIPYSGLGSYSPSNSGDIRQLAYSFIDAINNTYSNLPTGDRPSRMAISKTSSIPTEGIIRNNYNVIVNLAYSGLTVASE